MKKIELKIRDKKALYDSATRVVTHCNVYGVVFECEMPKDWALTRIFQFMDSLLDNTDKII